MIPRVGIFVNRDAESEEGQTLTAPMRWNKVTKVCGSFILVEVVNSDVVETVTSDTETVENVQNRDLNVRDQDSRPKIISLSKISFKFS